MHLHHQHRIGITQLKAKIAVKPKWQEIRFSSEKNPEKVLLEDKWETNACPVTAPVPPQMAAQNFECEFFWLQIVHAKMKISSHRFQRTICNIQIATLPFLTSSTCTIVISQNFSGRKISTFIYLFFTLYSFVCVYYVCVRTYYLFALYSYVLYFCTDYLCTLSLVSCFG